MAIMRIPTSSPNHKGGCKSSCHKFGFLYESIPHRRGSQVIVIHPGSRYIRIGKASDVVPVSVPCVVARKCKTETPKVTRIRNVVHPWNQVTKAEFAETTRAIEAGEIDAKDPVSWFNG